MKSLTKEEAGYLKHLSGLRFFMEFEPPEYVVALVDEGYVEVSWPRNHFSITSLGRNALAESEVTI